MEKRESWAYDDILNLPHHESPDRPRMPAGDRAVQFAPFAALSGYDAAVRETARLTAERAELDETQKLALNQRLRLLAERIGQRPEATITYFVPDKTKAGGAYRSVSGRIKRIDACQRLVIFTDGVCVPMDEIYGVEPAVPPPAE